MIEVADAFIQQADEKSVGFIGIDSQAPTVQSYENVSREECDSFVSVDEGVVHQEGFEERRGHGREVFVVAGLRAIESALQQAEVANSRGTAEDAQKSFVDGENFVEG
jgi:hypothetical protein